MTFRISSYALIALLVGSILATVAMLDISVEYIRTTHSLALESQLESTNASPVLRAIDEQHGRRKVVQLSTFAITGAAFLIWTMQLAAVARAVAPGRFMVTSRQVALAYLVPLWNFYAPFSILAKVIRDLPQIQANGRHMRKLIGLWACFWAAANLMTWSFVVMFSASRAELEFDETPDFSTYLSKIGSVVTDPLFILAALTAIAAVAMLTRAITASRTSVAAT